MIRMNAPSKPAAAAAPMTLDKPGGRLKPMDACRTKDTLTAVIKAAGTEAIQWNLRSRIR